MVIKVKEIHDFLRIIIFIGCSKEVTFDEIINYTQIDPQKITYFLNQLIQSNDLSLLNNKYTLTKNPNQYLIIDLLNQFDPFQDIKCVFYEDKTCHIYDDCSLCCFFKGLKKQFDEYIDLYTLDDLIKGACLTNE